MNLNDTDLNLFIAFEVIYNERNLTKAGEVLGITQPAVSNALSRPVSYTHLTLPTTPYV